MAACSAAWSPPARSRLPARMSSTVTGGRLEPEGDCAEAVRRQVENLVPQVRLGVVGEFAVGHHLPGHLHLAEGDAHVHGDRAAAVGVEHADGR